MARSTAANSLLLLVSLDKEGSFYLQPMARQLILTRQ